MISMVAVVFGDMLKALDFAGVTGKASKVSQPHDLGCPHKRPTKLPQMKRAIYTFEYQGQFLKIGKVGHKSKARYTTHHYQPDSCVSNLAKSLLSDPAMRAHGLTKVNVGQWIQTNVRRVDILMDEDIGAFAQNFMEAFLHCRLNPKYEG